MQTAVFCQENEKKLSGVSVPGCFLRMAISLRQ